MHSDTPDADLLALLDAAREGDPDALEGLLTEIYPSVRLHAHRRVRHRRDAESLADDVAQETLLRVIRSIASCQANTPGALYRWALTITNRVCADLARCPREACIQSTPNLEVLAESVSFREWFSLSWASESTSNKAVSDLLSCVLRSLPDGMVTILELRVQTEMTWPQIARQVRTTATAAKRRYERAQRRFRRDLLTHVLQLPALQQQAVSQRLQQMGIMLPLAGGPDDSH